MAWTSAAAALGDNLTVHMNRPSRMSVYRLDIIWTMYHNPPEFSPCLAVISRNEGIKVDAAAITR